MAIGGITINCAYNMRPTGNCSINILGHILCVLSRSVIHDLTEAIERHPNKNHYSYHDDSARTCSGGSGHVCTVDRAPDGNHVSGNRLCPAHNNGKSSRTTEGRVPTGNHIANGDYADDLNLMGTHTHDLVSMTTRDMSPRVNINISANSLLLVVTIRIGIGKITA